MGSTLARRIEALEECYGAMGEATLELLIRASFGERDAMERLRRCRPDSRLCRLIRQSILTAPRPPGETVH
jgi:hypothetical protein